MRALSREWEAPWDYWETRKQTDSNCTVEVHTMHLKRKSYRSPSSTLCPLSNPRSSCSTGAILLHCKKEGPLSLWANSVWTLRIEPKRRESLCFCSRGLGHSPSKVVGFAIFLISQLFLSRTASVLCYASFPPLSSISWWVLDLLSIFSCSIYLHRGYVVMACLFAV